MKDGLDLKAFLDSQSGEGVMDSEGSFTVAREKALQKLASFALPGEYDWVLKIVQAVNAWNAPRLVVRQSRVATSFFFCPPKGQAFPSESSILEALNTVSLDRDNPVHQLAMALRSLVQQVQLSFVLAVRQHGELCKPIYAGDDISGLDARTREEWTSLKTEGVRLTVSHFTGGESMTGRYLPTFTRQSRRDVGILRTLENRCFASSTAIEMDRRTLSRLFPRGDFFATHRFRPILLGRLSENGTSVLELEAVSVRLSRDHMTVGSNPEHRGSPWLLVTAPDWKMSNIAFSMTSRFLAPLSLQTEMAYHDIWWVRQGVVVGHHRFPGDAYSETRLSLIFPAEDLRTDLSGLQVELPARPKPVLDAMMALEKALTLGLGVGSFKDGLLAQPCRDDTRPSQGPAEEVLDQVGDSATTRSLAFELPTVGLGMLAMVDRATGLLAHLPLHEHRLKQWAQLTCGRIEWLARDLEKGESYLARSELNWRGRFSP